MMIVAWVGMGSMICPLLLMALWGLYGLYGALRAWSGGEVTFVMHSSAIW